MWRPGILNACFGPTGGQPPPLPGQDQRPRAETVSLVKLSERNSARDEGPLGTPPKDCRCGWDTHQRPSQSRGGAIVEAAMGMLSARGSAALLARFE
jgi:hypothetical protein